MFQKEHCKSKRCAAVNAPEWHDGTMTTIRSALGAKCVNPLHGSVFNHSVIDPNHKVTAIFAARCYCHALLLIDNFVM
jgi:hypothetical protein